MTTTEKSSATTAKTTESTNAKMPLADFLKSIEGKSATDQLKALKDREKSLKEAAAAEKAEREANKARQKEIEAAAAKEALKDELKVYQLPDTKVQVNIRWTPKNGFSDGRKEGYKTLKPEMSEAINAAIQQVLKVYFADPF